MNALSPIDQPDPVRLSTAELMVARMEAIGVKTPGLARILLVLGDRREKDQIERTIARQIAGRAFISEELLCLLDVLAHGWTPGEHEAFMPPLPMPPPRSAGTPEA